MSQIEHTDAETDGPALEGSRPINGWGRKEQIVLMLQNGESVERAAERVMNSLKEICGKQRISFKRAFTFGNKLHVLPVTFSDNEDFRKAGAYIRDNRQGEYLAKASQLQVIDTSKETHFVLDSTS